MPSWDDESARESAIWLAFYRFGWVVLAVAAVVCGFMCGLGIFMITGER